MAVASRARERREVNLFSSIAFRENKGIAFLYYAPSHRHPHHLGNIQVPAQCSPFLTGSACGHTQ